MEPLGDQPRHEARQRVDSLAVWTATAGALVCSAVVFLATNSTSPEPVAEPVPSAEWRLPAPPSTVETAWPGNTFEALAPPPPDAAVTIPPPLRAVTTTTTPPPPPPAPPATATTTPGPGAKQLHAVGAGKCLDVPNSTTTPGTQLQIYACNGRPNQAWTHTPSGQLTITLGGANRCMDAYDQATKPGTKVTIWPCNGQANQQWTVRPDGTIVGVQSGLCLDVTGASTANGALAELWTCNGQGNQQWTLS